MRYGAGPLPLAFKDDTLAWSAYWLSHVEEAGCVPVGQPWIETRSEVVGWTDDDGVYHEPRTACFVVGEVAKR